MKKYKKYFNATLVTAVAATTLVVAPILSAASANFSEVEQVDKDVLGLSKRKILGDFSGVTSPQLSDLYYGSIATLLNAEINGKGNGHSSNGNKGKGPNKNFTLSLMHTNDTHANLDKIAKKATAVNNVRAEKPKSLLINAGDVFSGTLYFNEYKGQADLEFMNLLGYDIMTFGNHEFDLGSSADGHKALADFIKGAEFAFVSSNIDFSKDNNLKGLYTDEISRNPKKGKIHNGTVKVINGQKVGFFGLTTAETKDISSPGAVQFVDYIEEAKKTVREFEKMGVNKIVAVTHIGYDDNPAYDNDLMLAEKVEGIDVIVGGHSHTKLDKPVVVAKDSTPTVIVQAYQYNDFLGTLDVEFNKDGVVVNHEGQLIEIGKLPEDEYTAKRLEPYKAKIKEVSEKEVGATATAALDNPRDSGDVTKPSVRKNETALGNVITDGMLAKAKHYNSKVIMALQNGGGIRAGINEGPITVGEVITVLPFGNTLATIELTGAELKATLEHSLKDYPKESGGFLHVSGAKIEFDSTKPMGQRVTKISYENGGQFTEINETEKYTIATNAFTAKGGDGFDILKKAYEEGRVTDLGLSDWENFAEHLTRLITVEPKVEDRIVDISKENQEIIVLQEDFSGTPDAPKVFTGNVVVNINDFSLLANAEIRGNLTIKGNTNNLSFANVKVTGNLDLSSLEVEALDIDGITVDGEIIL
ncbi:bifunctional metallophosphatase/5'-nucleotidase [Lysinibacillus sp. 54212]|uniref:bifunctional metallophosphatase/5'-nucleotidase n=1 Tax=Lysinibacillus sp. 54212 TaxID=3119829 RepID=UPI002FC7974E